MANAPVSVDEFFAAEAARVDAKWLEDLTKQIMTFVSSCPSNVPVALVTVRSERVCICSRSLQSGGTTVPLELNTVRSRVIVALLALSAHCFFVLFSLPRQLLRLGYRVVFLHRKSSMMPFTRKFTADTLFDAMQSDGTTCSLSADKNATFAPLIAARHAALKEGQLVQLPFGTVVEYLFALRAAVHALAPLGKRLLTLAAAAVSDFYIPTQSMAEHKIQSSRADPLVLHLEHVPKVLKCISTQWSPQGFMVSFKLETDPNLLASKAKGALQNSLPKLVIGNLLPTYKEKVHIFSPEGVKHIVRKENEDIEVELMADVAGSHKNFMT